MVALCAVIDISKIPNEKKDHMFIDDAQKNIVVIFSSFVQWKILAEFSPVLIRSSSSISRVNQNLKLHVGTFKTVCV